MQASPHREIDERARRCRCAKSPCDGLAPDTNVLSELRRLDPNPKSSPSVASQPLDLLYVSAASLAEIRFGIELVPDATRRAD